MRFNKSIQNVNGDDTVVLTDAKTGETKIAISGKAILEMIGANGEDVSRASIISIVEVQYPKLSTEEIKELFA